MTSENTPDSDIQEEVPQDSPASIGQMLREARESQGLTQAQVGSRIKLREALVKDLENDHFDNIPNNTYVKGYVTNYARALDLELAPLQKRLQEQLVHTEHGMKSFSRKTSNKAAEQRVNWISYIIILVLIGLSVLWWLQRSEQAANPDFSQPTQEEIAAQEQDTNLLDEAEALLREANAIEQKLSDEEETPAAPAEEQGDEAEPQTEEPPHTVSLEEVAEQPELAQNLAQLEQSAAEQALVSLRLLADCWMQISDADGAMIVNGLKKSGHEIELAAKTPLKFVIGAPQAVSLSIDGETVDLSSYQDTVARFSYPQSES
ncbi:RodZ domain-containing protein [Paraferrimonas sedimenticola]|uniref:HTH cro/C1-type domain-containing protein n=1 Tax=Paraferrimonas sedimenticola TaxID=375674 RepID=A0AA37VT11_9GAMM|nr:RodZ domain-containing protein [Paraferrimonas sedimenticola]GLP95094.1 hypothetical protein GCM10007895_04000 [Paraferrimonas sedimenticola]